MAYFEKYHHTYFDRHGDEYRISLREWNYSGASREVECGTEQFVIERANSGDIAMGAVYPTRATATFVSDTGFDLSDLYTGTEKTYLLTRLKNGVMDWQGNILADGFSRGNFDTDRDYLTVKASDNLSTLKGVPFTDASGENYGNDGVNIHSFLWAIKEGLKKTGFNMNIWTFVDLKPLLEGVTENAVLQLTVLRNASGFLRFVFGNDLAGAEAFNALLHVGTKLKISSTDIGTLEFTVNDNRVWQASTVHYLVDVWVDETIPSITQQSATVEVSQPVANVDMLDPLYHTEHDVRVWIRDSNVEGKTYYEARGGALDTWSVLNAIARQWGVVIQQNNGHWEVKRWNADKLPPGQYQWYVYNSEGTQIARQPFGVDSLLPCKPTDTEYRIYGSTLSMDRVLKNVIVNYRYKYKQDGDSLTNLVDNPNFENVIPGIIPNPGASTVPRWTNIRLGIPSYPMTIFPVTGLTIPPGINQAVELRNQFNTNFLANRSLQREANPIRNVNKGDNIKISWWEKIEGSGQHEDNVASILKFSLWPNQTYNPRSSDNYDVVMSGIKRTVVRTIGGVDTLHAQYAAKWQQKEQNDGHRFFGAILQETGGLGKGAWRFVEVEIEEVPIDGYIVFEIYGIAAVPANEPPSYRTANKDAASVRINNWVMKGEGASRRFSLDETYAYLSYSPLIWNTYKLTITGIQFNKLLDADNKAVPQIDPFMYPDYHAQLTREFTDTISEIEVLTGDDYGEYADDRISGMSWGGERTQFWDTWDSRFGWSRQGLITAKSLMELYWSPTRLLSCEVSMKDIHWSTRFMFEELPGRRFVILSGSIGGQDSTFRGVLKEIFDSAETPLPPGGDDGGNTTSPNWQPTGVTRCIKDEDGLNTGGVERVETDVNRASPTYGQERRRPAGTDTDMCPIGMPDDILWGEQLVLDVSGLRTQPYGKIDDTYSVTYSNDGSDRYLRFLHRADIGTIRSIVWNGGFENISGWEYEPDVVIDGYTYKHIRLTWFVGVFEGLTVFFEIN